MSVHGLRIKPLEPHGVKVRTDRNTRQNTMWKTTATVTFHLEVEWSHNHSKIAAIVNQHR